MRSSIVTRGDPISFKFRCDLRRNLPTIDTRDMAIKSRDGQKAEAPLLEKGRDLFNFVNGPDGQELVVIDEAQFFDRSIVYAVQILKHNGYNVVIGGLDKDFMGQPFGFMP